MRVARLLAILLPFALVGQTFLSAAPPETPAPKASADWPGFLGPHRNGKSDEHGLPTTWPPKGPPVVWHKAVGTGYSAPAISDGKLFHFSRTKDSAQLKCFNAETGAEQWTCEYPTDFVDMLGYNNGPRATPIVDGPNVYTFGAEGMLQCVRIADGHPVWRIDTTKQFNVVKNFFGVGSTPLVWNDLLLVNVGGSPPGGPTDVYAADGKVDSSGSAIVAFDKATGAVRWQTGNDLASYSSPVVAKIAGRDVVFMFARSGLLGDRSGEGSDDRRIPLASPQAGKRQRFDARRGRQRDLHFRNLRSWQRGRALRRRNVHRSVDRPQPPPQSGDGPPLEHGRSKTTAISTAPAATTRQRLSCAASNGRLAKSCGAKRTWVALR